MWNICIELSSNAGQQFLYSEIKELYMYHYILFWGRNLSDTSESYFSGIGITPDFIFSVLKL